MGVAECQPGEEVCGGTSGFAEESGGLRVKRMRVDASSFAAKAAGVNYESRAAMDGITRERGIKAA